MLNFVFGFTVCFAISATTYAYQTTVKLIDQKEDIKNLKIDKEYYWKELGRENAEIDRLNSKVHYYEKQLNLN